MDGAHFQGFLIVLVCSGIYTIRTIVAGAFLVPGAMVSSAMMRIGGTIAVAAFLALAAIKLLGNGMVAETQDNGGTVLAVVSGVFLLVSVVLMWVRKRKEDKKEE